jgi:GNAT superfamily N-acetyltransferase
MNLQIIRTRHPPVTFIEQLALIHTEEGFPATSSDIRLRIENLARTDRLLFALDGETLLGYAHIRVSGDLLNDDTSELVSIFVRKPFQGHNVGRQLVNAVETWARESGSTRLLLRLDATLSDAQPFFMSLGFEHAATRLDFIRKLD